MHLFDSFMGIHESDPQLFWKLKPDYDSPMFKTNSDGFVGAPITEKQPGEFRLLFLGDSTPLGIGLDDPGGSFVFKLEQLLRQNAPERKITVINTSTAGYSSYQCRRLLELKGEKLKPDLVITYFGNNDPSINGYLSDSELAGVTGSYSSLKSFLGRSYIYQALKVILLNLKVNLKNRSNLKIRVPLADAEENLREIFSWCGKHKATLMICTIPTPNLWPPGIQFKVFATGKDKSGRLLMADQMRQDISASWALCLDTTLLPGQDDLWVQKVYASGFREKGDIILQERFYRSQLELDPQNSQYLNNLGVLLWQQGREADSLFAAALQIDSLNTKILYNFGITRYHTDCKQARDFLWKAKELDPYSLRIKSKYNQMYRQFAMNNGILLLELEEIFSNLPEKEYFVDHCHPAIAGHQLVAEMLYKAVTNTKSW